MTISALSRDSFAPGVAELDELNLQDLLAGDVVPTPAWKRTIDIFAAFFGILFLSPLLLILSIAIVLDSRGGPIFRQARVGHGGKLFTCWKFRSMRHDAEQLKEALMQENEANGLIFKMKDDPRRTRVGKFLRKTSLDELPQLWNVLRGDMSLVGPRPPLPSEVVRYDDAHLQRLIAIPGITGLWQVTLRGRHDFGDMVALDIEYARTRSFWLDVKILFRTVGTVLRGSGSY
jgi:lipopolysaccharide/colanic/teichoic acid biosynthesis glycosyltransferase